LCIVLYRDIATIYPVSARGEGHWNMLSKLNVLWGLRRITRQYSSCSQR